MLFNLLKKACEKHILLEKLCDSRMHGHVLILKVGL
jgi:hypothetical protein